MGLLVRVDLMFVKSLFFQFLWNIIRILQTHFASLEMRSTNSFSSRFIYNLLVALVLIYTSAYLWCWDQSWFSIPHQTFLRPSLSFAIQTSYLLPI